MGWDHPAASHGEKVFQPASTRECTLVLIRDVVPSKKRARVPLSFSDLPELWRHQYFSDISIVERVGTRVTSHDPLREQGLIPYPPAYARITVSAPDEK